MLGSRQQSIGSMHATCASAIIAALLASASLALAAPSQDRLLRGERMIVRDGRGGDPAGRTVKARGSSSAPVAPPSGDPFLSFAGGAVLEVAAVGGTASGVVFQLPPGTRSDGRPFWRPIGSGWAYADPRGERGPLRKLTLKHTRKGVLKLSGDLAGRDAPLDIVPPEPGVGGFLALSLAGGDRYCVGFGTGARQVNRMRRWAARAASSETCGPPPAPSGDFLALAYNVAGLPQGLSGSNPATNTPLIAPLLNGYDIVGLQESWQTPDPNPLAPLRVYHEILVEGTDHPYKTEALPQPMGNNPARPSALVSDGLAIFSRYPFDTVAHVPWAQCWETAADCLAMKGFMMARTTVAPGVTIDVYTLHKEAGSAPEDHASRDAGITQMIEFINANSAGKAMIVGGDFNLHTNNQPAATQFARLLDETGLIDVCAALGCPQPGRIDKWLFRSGDTIAIEPLSWRFETDVFVDGGGGPLSDHDALAVRFAWEAIAP